MNKAMKNLIFLAIVVLAFGFISVANAYVTVGGYTVKEGGAGSASLLANTNQVATKPEAAKCVKPIINYITPDTATVNSGAKKVTIVGSCFTPSSQAKFNSANRPTTFVDSKKLVIDLSSNDTKAVGKFLVTVFEPTVNEFSNSAFFTVKTATVAKKSTASKASVDQKETVECVSSTLASATDSDLDQGLTANALFGFLAGDSFMPNTLLGWVFLFIFILLGVKLWRKVTENEREKNAPLKHA